MYAVIRAGGRQCRVQVGDVVRVDRLEGDKGSPVVFDEVLALGDGDSVKVGSPVIAGAKVQGTVLDQDRGKKVLTYMFKRRQNANRKRRGHRQDYTAVRIDAIQG